MRIPAQLLWDHRTSPALWLLLQVCWFKVSLPSLQRFFLSHMTWHKLKPELHKSREAKKTELVSYVSSCVVLWSGVRPAGRLCCFGFQLWRVWLTQGDGPMCLSIRGRQRGCLLWPLNHYMRYSHFAHFLPPHPPPPDPKSLREAVDGPLRSF